VSGLARLRPRRWLRSITLLDPDELRAQGIRGVIVDLDNTLVPYGHPDVPAEIRAWIGRIRAAGLRLCLVTNNRGRRARAIAAALEIPLAPGWAKPATSMLRRALAIMETNAAETALVGDQILTDILAGNRAGLYTVLVSPLSEREFLTTRIFNRTLERVVRRLLGLVPPGAR